MINGEKLAIDTNEIEGETVNALGVPNGRQQLASPAQVAVIKDHIRTMSSRKNNENNEPLDFRPAVRTIEQLLFQTYVGSLVGNQCLDFQKQDGVTEMEEALAANAVERRLNDLLWVELTHGRVRFGGGGGTRRPIYVSTVSNFTNFLDLSRKTLRSLEVGIPVIVLGRHASCQQHVYRWTQLLVDLCSDAGIDPSMVSFLSCTLKDTQDIISSCQEYTGNLYVTGSRKLAAEIKAVYPATVASTSGPNTLICTSSLASPAASAASSAMSANSDDNDDEKIDMALLLRAAVANSAAIESAGQCTALRHCVVPSTVTDLECHDIFNTLSSIDDAAAAASQRVYAGVFSHSATPRPPVADKENKDSTGGLYKKHKSVDAYYKIRDDEFPEFGMNEYWRQVAVDFTRMDLVTTDVGGKRRFNTERLNQLANWLNENQPISMAVNGPRNEAISLGIKLWEKTSLVVNTIGSSSHVDMPPALTCQARPQEGEIFGELPPRNSLDQNTTFPVIIPSSNPSYGAVYSNDYLQTRGAVLSDYIIKSTKSLLEAIQDDTVRGYCILLIEYLQNVARLNPKRGFGRSRTALWGIQRPPLGKTTVIRCDKECSWDQIVSIYIIFHATTARDQIELSINAGNTHLVQFCIQHKLRHIIEDDQAALNSQSCRDDVFQWIGAPNGMSKDNWPMVGNFVSLYFPVGHIKSTMANDDEFELQVRLSHKWLNTLF